MKKAGILNARLSKVVAALGHTDRLVVCDCGLPVPREAEIIDLSVARNLPRFADVLRVILEELVVEEAVVALELPRKNIPIWKETRALLDAVPVKEVPHEEFKRVTRRNATTVFVRTGEATPYANVLLIAGVAF